MHHVVEHSDGVLLPAPEHHASMFQPLEFIERLPAGHDQRRHGREFGPQRKQQSKTPGFYQKDHSFFVPVKQPAILVTVDCGFDERLDAFGNRPLPIAVSDALNYG